jgi:cyclase
LLNTRIIPVLNVLKGKLVKTRQFQSSVYIGDPINALKIFNEKRVDELIVTDIGATRSKQEPDYGHLKEMASECFIPLAYGGGIQKISQAEKVFQCGIEKVIINSALTPDLLFLKQLVAAFGSQSVVACVDYKKNWLGRLSAYSLSGTKNLKGNLESWIGMIAEAGAGEIMLQDISRDGMFSGYDLDFVNKIAKQITVPVIACGGAKDYAECISVLVKTDIAAAAAGSCFVFKNQNRNSILINYKR